MKTKLVLTIYLLLFLQFIKNKVNSTNFLEVVKQIVQILYIF